MTYLPSRKAAANLLIAAGFILALSLGAGTCPGNVGSIYSIGQDQDDDDDGDGTQAPGPASAPSKGSLIRTGRPTLQALAPRSGLSGIDVRAVVVLWFSESLNPGTISTNSLGIRSAESGGSLARTVLTFAADRCVALIPNSPLLPSTTYQVFGTTTVTDLEGKRLVVPASEVLGSFRTAAATTGVAPRVLGSFPPANATGVPNDYPVITVFSKPVDFTTVSGAVAIDNLTTAVAGSFFPPTSLAGDRIIRFDHLDPDSDLGADLSLSVAATITDKEFTPLPLSAPFSADWTTLAFAPPVLIDVLGALAVNLVNIGAFPVDVGVPPSVLAGDTVELRIHEASGSDFVATSSPVAVALPLFSFVADLDTAAGVPRLSDGPLVLAAFVQRGTQRSTITVLNGFGQDTVRPELLEFGPPFASLPSRFVTNLPELRPYGVADEPIVEVEAEFPVSSGFVGRSVPFGDLDGFFLGPAFAAGTITEGPVAFKIKLTDASGNPLNPGNDPSDATAVFRGFVGGAPLAATPLRVVAFNRRTLEPISGATVYVEDLGGAGPASALTGSNGAATFAGRTGAQTVTVKHPAYFAATIVGVDADLLSLPLRESISSSEQVAPIITGVSGGGIRFGSPILEDAFAVPRPDALFDTTLPLGLNSVGVRPDRPAWFSAFHDVQPYGGDPVNGRYFERFGLDIARVIPPSDPARLQVEPLVPMLATTNSIGSATDYLYSWSAGGPDFDPPIAESSAAGVVILPGLEGVAPVGTGSLAGGAAEIEVEVLLHAIAVADEGAAAGDLLVQTYARDSDGEEFLLRVTTPLVAGPTALGAFILPDVPAVPSQGAAQPYPPTLSFAPSLGAGDGYYLLVLEDTAPFPAQWDVWVPASAGAGGSITLPVLGPGPANPPLMLGSWELFCEAYGMPGGFSETAFFFAQLSRDNETWARSVPGPPFTVTP